MYNASPLFELALILAAEIGGDATPQSYATTSIAIGALHEPQHLYVGEVRYLLDAVNPKLTISGLSCFDDAIFKAPGFTHQVFTYIYFGGVTGLFVGYRIALNR